MEPCHRAAIFAKHPALCWLCGKPEWAHGLHRQRERRAYSLSQQYCRSRQSSCYPMDAAGHSLHAVDWLRELQLTPGEVPEKLFPWPGDLDFLHMVQVAGY